jgi:TetR/AcrR family transcriptional regulator, transcriptional repressor for nem operon
VQGIFWSPAIAEWTSKSRLSTFGGVIESPKTARGRETRERIVTSAAELIGERGVAETSLDDVIERAGASKSQLYHYFDDREALLRAVVLHNCDGVLAAQSPHLGSLDSWKAIRAWFDALVRLQIERDAHGGCPVGSLVGQLAEADELARLDLEASFERWEREIREGLRSMQYRGKLAREAKPDELATATLAAIQGGLLLTQTRRDPGQLAIALDAAYAHLRAHAAS